MNINCWDYMKCGRELGGKKVDECGVCPVVTYTAFNKINDGFNGGRYCWEIVGTFPISNLRCSLQLKSKTVLCATFINW